ncbi:MAG: helix-turn-helix domain-containing protein [Candidatus Acidiferrales bacterium]
MEKLLFSKKEAAVAIGVSIRTLENMISIGEIPTRRIGRRRLIESQQLARFCRHDHATQATQTESANANGKNLGKTAEQPRTEP